MCIREWINPETMLLGPSCPLPLVAPFTKDEAVALGVSSWRVRGLLADGLIRPVLRGVYAASQSNDNISFRAAALAKVIPPSAVITDRTAAWLHGVSILPRTALHQVPPINCFDTRPGHRTRRPGVGSGERRLPSYDVMELHGVMVTTPLRTALDLGRLLWRFDALAALDGFLAIGVPHDQILAEMPRFRHFRGVVQLRALAPLADGLAESPGESALRLHWYDAGLPRPQLQHWVFDEHGVGIYRLDITLPELRYAAEYDGEEFHSADPDLEHDDERRGWIEKHRHWTIDPFRKADVYGRHEDPAPTLRDGLRRARRSMTRWSPESIRIPGQRQSAGQPLRAREE